MSMGKRILAGSKEDKRWLPGPQTQAEIEYAQRVVAKRVKMPAAEEAEPVVEPCQETVDAEPVVENVEDTACQPEVDTAELPESGIPNVDIENPNGYIEDKTSG